MFSATREVASATVSKGDIVLTLAADLGTGIGGQTVTMTMKPGTSSLTWFNSTTVTNPAAKEAITKNNIPVATSTL